MQRHFDQELAQLKEQLLRMGSVVEGQIFRAMQSLVERDSDLAQVVVIHDHDVNSLDVDIDDACIKLLALHQPTARDLRFITTAMKISSELERMGDLAENIARRVLEKGTRTGKFLQALPLLVPVVCAYTLGEWLGYLLGTGDALEEVE